MGVGHFQRKAHATMAPDDPGIELQQKTSISRSLKRLATSLAARLARRPRLTADQLLRLEPGRVLVVRQHNQMGDMVCATPVFRALRETFPSARIALVTAPVNREVVQNNPHLDQVFTFEQKMWRRPGALAGFLKDIRSFGPDVAFVLSSVSFSVTSAGIALASGAPLVVGAQSDPFGIDLSRHAFSLEMPSIPILDRHAVKHSLAPLQAIGITTDDLSTLVVPSEQEEARARAIMEKLEVSEGFWALHPGAGKKQNIWPAERFAQLARQAVAAGHQVLVMHGPADVQALVELEQLLAEELGRGVYICPPCPVGVGAALLTRADRFLCNDTGVMHMAGAVGAPTVALFGPTDPELWKPPTDLVVALKSPRQSPDDRGREFGWMENLTTEEVWQAWAGLPGRRGRN
jgi:ADP-heptose:LPS heptosyltransferase